MKRLSRMNTPNAKEALEDTLYSFGKVKCRIVKGLRPKMERISDGRGTILYHE